MSRRSFTFRNVSYGFLAALTGLLLSSWCDSAAGQATYRNDSQIYIQGQGYVPNPVPAGQGYINPRVPAVGQGGGYYGDYRRHGGNDSWHRGNDLSAPVGTPVQATTGGWVTQSQTQGGPGYGNQVRVVDSNGNVHLYAHLTGNQQVRQGTLIEAGQVIGEVGRSGNTPAQGASHLHYEVRDRNNQSIPITPSNDGSEATRWQGYQTYLDSLPRQAPANTPAPITAPAVNPAPANQPAPYQQVPAQPDLGGNGNYTADSARLTFDENAQPAPSVQVRPRQPGQSAATAAARW